MFSVAHMNDNIMCKIKVGLYIPKVIAFSMLGVEITYCKLTEKHRSVITVPCYKMRLQFDRASDSNTFDTNLIRKDGAFITYEQHYH